MYLLNGKKIDETQQFTIGTGDEAITYPPNWTAYATPDEIKAVGITEVPDPVRPDDRINDVTVNPDGSYKATPKDLAKLKADAKNKVDELCGDRRAFFVSQGNFIAEEYRLAYDDALSYKAAGYTGAVPASVQAWATASGATPKAAADDIIAARQSYMSILAGIRAIRLQSKADIDAALDGAAVSAIVDSVSVKLTGVH